MPQQLSSAYEIRVSRLALVSCRERPIVAETKVALIAHIILALEPSVRASSDFSMSGSFYLIMH